MSNKKIFIILLAILILGGFLRFYKLGEQPFVTDEFLDINAAYGYYQTGKWQAWDFNLGQVSQDLYGLRDERTWLYRWQVAQLFHWFSPTEVAARSVSAVWGLISIVVLYFAATYFTKSRTVGLISAFLFSVSISGIVFDRMLRMYSMFFPVFLLFSWFLFRFLEEEYKGKIALVKKIQTVAGINAIWLVPAIVAGLASWHLHPLTINIFIILVLYFIIQAGANWYQKRSYVNKYTIMLLLMLAGAAGYYLYNPKNFLFYFNLLDFLKNNLSYFSAAVSDWSHLILSYSFILLGLFFLVKNSESRKGAVWLAACFLSIVGMAAFFWKMSFGPRFIFFAKSFGIILLSSGIYALAIFLKENLARYKNQIFAAVMTSALLVVPNWAYFFSQENSYSRSENSPDYRKAFQYFLKKRGAQDMLVTKNFRSFYFRDAGAKVYNIKSRKIDLAELHDILAANRSGWVVTGDVKGDFEKGAIDFMENNFKKKETGGVNLYRWQSPEEKN
ncbi:MAG: hypothetical protein NT136_03850 [Candidatus Moranbacteria bacterium]|nr:hypothetical protein [Candidatus Moranbacteria bacterium]